MPGRTSTTEEEQPISVFQESCALTYEPALPPLKIAILEAKSPILKSSCLVSVGYKENHRHSLVASLTVLPN